MRVKAKESKPKKRFTLALTEKEAGYLSGLADALWWYEQPAELWAFMEGLYNALEEAGIAESAEEVGYVGRSA